MTFRDTRFPTGIRYGAVMGPRWNVPTARLPSGYSQKNLLAEFPLRRFRVERALRDESTRDAFLAFVYAMDGPFHSFRLKDPSDFEVETGEGVVEAYGSPSGFQYQLQKRYTSGSFTKDIDVLLPVSGFVLKAGAQTLVLNTDYTIDLTTPSGVVTVAGSPIPVPTAWTGEYDIHAAFDAEEFQLLAHDIDLFFAQQLTITEERRP